MKRHEIKFKTSKGLFSIETDDIDDLLSKPIIQDLLDMQPIKQNNVQPRNSIKDDNYVRAQKDLDELRAEINKIKSIAKEDSSENASPDQTLQSQKQTQQHPQQRPPLPRFPSNSGQLTKQQVLPETFLNITPDAMQKNIWDTLTPVQQQEWLRKYNMTQ